MMMFFIDFLNSDCDWSVIETCSSASHAQLVAEIWPALLPTDYRILGGSGISTSNVSGLIQRSLQKFCKVGLWLMGSQGIKAVSVVSELRHF